MTSQLALDLIQPLAPTLDNFVPGPNGEALATLRSALAGAGPSFVYLWGSVGSGRSHLLCACTPSNSSERVPDFESSRTTYAVDDVGTLDDDDQQRLFRLANEVRATAGTVLIAAGDMPPAQLALRDDVRTRLAWGLVHQLHPLSDDDKAEALLRHARSRGFSLSTEVIAFMLSHLPRDMRTLIAILDALDARALAARRAITVPFIREWISSAST